MKSQSEKLIYLLELLNGYKSPLRCNDLEYQLIYPFPSDGVGYSQFNELQLSFGFNRVSKEFFQFLLDQTLDWKNGGFKTIEELEKKIVDFLAIALLFYGSIEQAFKILSVDSNELKTNLDLIRSIPISEFENRHSPIHPIKEISGKDTYYLGHLVQDEIKEEYKKDPNNPKNKEEYHHSIKILEIGKENYSSYLASDHLDVYIATSMRAKEDYYMVNKWVNEIFNHESIKNLNLRWFDPTQAYCDNSVDKGLFEGLMLKRAECTVYFVQESDTFGKNSELASTLAQGKPVIAYVPRVDKKYVDEFIDHLREIYPEKSENDIILDKLKEYNPLLAWDDIEIQMWVSDRSTFQLNKAKEKLYETMLKKYDDRASLLSKKHPLRVQVCLENGVANGVLVVRDLDTCARIIESVVLRTMKFIFNESNEEGIHSYYYLIEENSNCIFRLATGDQMLTNTFWNYYTTKID